MAYRIELTRAASKQIDALDATVRSRILKAIHRLAIDPYGAANVKALVGEAGFRLRVGD